MMSSGSRLCRGSLIRTRAASPQQQLPAAQFFFLSPSSFRSSLQRFSSSSSSSSPPSSKSSLSDSDSMDMDDEEFFRPSVFPERREQLTPDAEVPPQHGFFERQKMLGRGQYFSEDDVTETEAQVLEEGFEETFRFDGEEEKAEFKDIYDNPKIIPPRLQNPIRDALGRAYGVLLGLPREGRTFLSSVASALRRPSCPLPTHLFLTSSFFFLIFFLFFVPHVPRHRAP